MLVTTEYRHILHVRPTINGWIIMTDLGDIAFQTRDETLDYVNRLMRAYDKHRPETERETEPKKK